MDEFRNTVGCRLYDIRHPVVYSREILEKGVRVLLCHLHDALMLTLCAL